MKWFSFILTLSVVSCGANLNKLNQTSSSQTIQSSSSTSVSCLCTSDYAPVCDKDANKDYDNACLAKCFGATNTAVGHCLCDNARTVCGSDNQNHGECDAISQGITITKYIPCGSNSI